MEISPAGRLPCVMRKLLFLLFFLPALLRAQGSGTNVLNGTVTDAENREAIPFSAVTLLRHDSVLAYTNADIDGRFRFSGLSAGSYVIKVVAVGYFKQVVGMELENNRSQQMTFLLSNQHAPETIEVVSYQVPLIDTDCGKCIDYPFPGPRRYKWWQWRKKHRWGLSSFHLHTFRPLL